MFQFEIVILRVFAIGFIGVTMFFSLIGVRDLLCNVRPLKKRDKWGKESKKGRKKLIIIMYGITLFIITAFIFLLIKLILRGEV